MSAAANDSIVLDVRAMRIQVRTDRGEGPVLVDDVSLTLKRGEVIGLIGKSGAGKSTIGLASMGYTRRDCYIVGGQILFERQGHPHDQRRGAARVARAQDRLYRTERRGLVQSRAHADGAGLRGGDPPWRAVAGGGARRGDQPFQTARSAEPRDDRRALSASGLRRTVAARDGGDGDGRQARHSDLRRADDRARRDDAGRVPGRVSQAHPRARHGGAVHHPRPRRRRADRRSDHGAQAGQDGRIRRFQANSPAAEGGIHAPPGERARRRPQIPRGRRRRRAADSGDRPRQRRLSGKARGDRRRQPRSAQRRHGGGRRRIRARANRPWRASSWDCCRAAPATCGSTGQVCRRA